MNGDADVDAFVRLLDALGPWLSQVVIIGGWAHRLYRIHPNAQGLDYPPLMTVDTDVAVPATIQCAEQDIRGRLLAYGFAEELLGDDQPPATHYRLGDGEFYVEFLTPLRGPEYNRKNRRNATVGVGGIVSQRLRYVDILLYSPWSVDFEPHGFRGKVQIANPVSFLAQKILIHSKRDREDRAKDILYMRDTIEVFGPRLTALRHLWIESVSGQLHERAVRAVSAAGEALFHEVTDDIRRAAEISVGRVSAEAVRVACRDGFNHVFPSRMRQK